MRSVCSSLPSTILLEVKRRTKHLPSYFSGKRVVSGFSYGLVIHEARSQCLAIYSTCFPDFHHVLKCYLPHKVSSSHLTRTLKLGAHRHTPMSLNPPEAALFFFKYSTEHFKAYHIIVFMFLFVSP